ncbi:MAG: hypothetical protein LBD60_03630 [Puniceicoccales bacterium]|jgi:hypothetical protein|nr:hypothetical protein [Puniceicoccales bacterium]
MEKNIKIISLSFLCLLSADASQRWDNNIRHGRDWRRLNNSKSAQEVPAPKRKTQQVQKQSHKNKKWGQQAVSKKPKQPTQSHSKSYTSLVVRNSPSATQLNRSSVQALPLATQPDRNSRSAYSQLRPRELPSNLSGNSSGAAVANVQKVNTRPKPIEDLTQKRAEHDQSITSLKDQLVETSVTGRNKLPTKHDGAEDTQQKQIEDLMQKLTERDKTIANLKDQVAKAKALCGNIPLSSSSLPLYIPPPPPPPPPPSSKKLTKDMYGRSIDENGQVIGAAKKSSPQPVGPGTSLPNPFDLIKQGNFKINLTLTEQSAEMAKAANQRVQEAAKIVQESRDQDAVKQALKAVIIETERTRLAAKAAQSQLKTSLKNILREERRKEIQAAAETATTTKNTAKKTAKDAIAAAKSLIDNDKVDAIEKEAKAEVENAENDKNKQKKIPPKGDPKSLSPKELVEAMAEYRSAWKKSSDDSDDGTKAESSEW